MKILGYSGGWGGSLFRFDAGHDAAAAIVVDGEVVAACEERRFSGGKRGRRLPRHAIEFCLDKAGVRDASELDAVVCAFSLPLMHHPRQYTENGWRLSPSVRPIAWAAHRAARLAHQTGRNDHGRSREVFEHELGVRLRPGQFMVVPHHTAHVASAFYGSPFERALCVSLESEGESASGVVALASEREFKILRHTYAPNSLGRFHTLLSRYLGFDTDDESKRVALAPYGDPTRFRAFFRDVVRTLPDGRFSIDPQLMLALQFRDAVFGAKRWLYPSALVRVLGAPRDPGDAVTQRHRDIAAALQESLENTTLHVLEHFRRATGERNLCMTGRLARNSGSHGSLARSGLFDGVWIPPAAEDVGTAAGAALHTFHKRGSVRPRAGVPVDRGPTLEESALRFTNRRVARETTPRRRSDLYEAVANVIDARRVVEWFQSRSD